jgi:hypothetical protein
MFDRDLQILRGSLILVPVVNVFGFERHSRYLPDRRDLNRSFPGDSQGSLAFRLARAIFVEVLSRSDYGIDLHTATTGRTNFPHVRAAMSLPGVADVARWFGCEVIVDRRGDERSLREVANNRGCKTILLEAGEALKIESGVVTLGVRGVKNVLIRLGMVEGEPRVPVYQTVVRRTVWVRSVSGGLLHFHIRPGDLVEEGAALATCDAFFRQESPFAGVGHRAGYDYAADCATWRADLPHRHTGASRVGDPERARSLAQHAASPRARSHGSRHAYRPASTPQALAIVIASLTRRCVV